MKLLSSMRRKAAAAALVVLLLFLFRPGASRLKSRIIASISAGVGRSADIGAVHFHLLPRPGFDLENLVVYDDPAFGAEPMLRASEVTADLRLISLLRGRLEIARLDLTEPSLNLVHGANGRWNLEALLERTSHTPLAPTAKMKSERRQEFPYIHATSARINLKSGDEKKPYALTNADFSLWQDSENAWGVRLKAQPLRTDLNLNDTGILQVNGTWQRAAVFRETPMDFTLEWSRGQLGQLSKFFRGSDQGWRGGVQLDLAMKGTPAALQIASDASVQDFRRYDITSGDALTLAAHCDGQYSAVDHAFHQLDCKAPVGGGLITLKGEMGLPGSHRYQLLVAAENVPASAAALLVRRVKKNLPDDLLASGTVQGSVTIHEDPAKDFAARLEGKGEIAELQLSSVANNAELGPEAVPFVIASDSSASIAAKRGAVRDKIISPTSPRLEIGPFWFGATRTNSPTVRALLTRSGYVASVAGDAEIAKTLRVARVFGIPALLSTAEGTAGVDLQVAGSWGYGPQSGFLGPQVTGLAKLHNVKVAVRGTAAPVEISSAELQLLPNEVRVNKLTANAADAVWTGTLAMPRGCGNPGACEVRFNLHANKVAFTELAAWAHPSAKQRPWYRVLESSPQTGPAFLASLRASGTVSAARLQVQKLAATQVSANVDLDHGKIRISNLTADWLDGTHRGEWLADFSSTPAMCNGNGTLAGVSLARLENAGWITGMANGEYQVKGPCSAEFWQTAEGTFQFDVRDGTLPHLSLAENEGGIKLSRLWGRARLQGGKFETKEVWLNSPAGKFQINGTAGLNRGLEIKLTRTVPGSNPTASSGGYAITGTLSEPRVTPYPAAEQARLKP